LASQEIDCFGRVGPDGKPRNELDEHEASTAEEEKKPRRERSSPRLWKVFWCTSALLALLLLIKNEVQWNTRVSSVETKTMLPAFPIRWMVLTLTIAVSNWLIGMCLKWSGWTWKTLLQAQRPFSWF
jgi:hypothetical protein